MWVNGGINYYLTPAPFGQRGYPRRVQLGLKLLF
jgi:hypothetical protein